MHWLASIVFRGTNIEPGRNLDLYFSFFYFFIFLKEEDLDDPGVLSGPVALVSVVGNDESEDASLQPLSISIVLEDEVVVSNLQSWPDAVMVLFGLLYALHLSYPKGMVQTFEFIQKLLLKVDDVKLKPKLLALKNELLR